MGPYVNVMIYRSAVCRPDLTWTETSELTRAWLAQRIDTP